MGGNVPGYIGTSQTRAFELVGKVLTMTARTFFGLAPGSREIA